jgi:hypothetical protein
MSWSLRLSNGDFTPSGGSYALARGENKLIQDLRCRILERIGTDPFHPEFGSDIDSPSVIGQTTDFAAIEIESEIRRVITDLQKQQIQRAQVEQLTRGRTTLDKGEVLVSLSNLELTQSLDQILVKITLITGDESTFTFEIPLDANTA